VVLPALLARAVVEQRLEDLADQAVGVRTCIAPGGGFLIGEGDWVFRYRMRGIWTWNAL
jgi:hypothetical protein